MRWRRRWPGPGNILSWKNRLGATYEQAVATTELPYLYGIKMMIAENYRYSEEFNLIRKLVAEKKIGETGLLHIP